MGFEGVILTDDVAMKGFSATFGIKNSYVIALNAGIDMIIANGKDPDILYDIIDGKDIGTRFLGRVK